VALSTVASDVARFACNGEIFGARSRPFFWRLFRRFTFDEKWATRQLLVPLFGRKGEPHARTAPRSRSDREPRPDPTIQSSSGSVGGVRSLRKWSAPSGAAIA
jgi:hypothetical protein